jgi:hypothetical protein
MRMLIASAYTNVYFQSGIVPADGTTAATVGNGDFGTSPFFGQQDAASGYILTFAGFDNYPVTQGAEIKSHLYPL